MIQRIQTLLLLLSAVTMVCFSLGEIAQIQTTTDTLSIGVWQIFSKSGLVKFTPWHSLAITSLTILLPIIAIFLYKNLKLQKRLCYISVLFDVVLFLILAVECYLMLDSIFISWSPIVFVPIASICLNCAAIKYVNKDINLLRSYDRIR